MLLLFLFPVLGRPGPANGAQRLQEADTLYRDLFPYQMQFDHLSVEDGLSNNTVYAILQDSQGFMWFGTEGGLNRFDGYDFTVFKRDLDDPLTLRNNTVLDIHEDREGALWIATFGGGLNRFDPETETFSHYVHDEGDNRSLSNNYVVRIYEDREGIFWLTTEGGGLNRFDPAAETFTAYRHDPDDPQSISHDIVTRVLEDSHGDFWVGTDGGGLNRFDRETGTFERFQHDADDPGSISNDIIWSLLEDREGVLWVGTFGGGLNRLQRETNSFAHYRHDPEDPHSLGTDDTRFLFEDSEGILWIGTAGAGLERFDRERDAFIHVPAAPGEPGALQSGLIWSMAEDQSGLLWIGTVGEGIHRYNRSREQFAYATAANGLDGTGVGSLYEDRAGNLWITSWEGGLDRLDRSTGEISHYHHEPERADSISNNITGPMREDNEGILWVGTFGGGLNGLDLKAPRNMDPETASFKRVGLAGQAGARFDDIVWSLHVDSDGMLWAGTQTGLVANAKGAKPVRYQHDEADEESLSNDVIRVIKEDRQGRLWIGTDVGLNRFDRERGVFSHYVHDPEDANSPSSNLIQDILVDSSGILWLGSWGGGLDRFDPEAERFVRYGEKDGLPSDTVLAIAEDNTGILWLSTNKGLVRFDPDTEQLQALDSSDGLQGLEMGALLHSRTGELLVGESEGFTVFDPAGLTSDEAPPPLVLTLLAQGGESLGVAPQLHAVTLRWPLNFFEFEVAALSYLQPEKNRYAYMLEGFDGDWNEAGARRFARYTNLPGGNYTLRVRGANSAGVWNEEGLALTVRVIPPFWATWWFRGLVGLALLGLGAGAYHWRLRSLSAQQRELEAQVVERTRELTALYAIAAEASRSLDLQQILDTSLEQVLALFDVEAGGIYLLNEDGETLQLVAQRGLGAPLAAAIDNLALGEGFSGRVVSSGEPLVVDDLRTDPRLTRVAVREGGFQRVAVVPVGAKGRTSGSLFILTPRARHFSTEDVALLASIGAQMGVALEHARLFSREQERAEQFQLINEVGRRITSILDIEELLQEIVQLIQHTFGYYHVAIGLVEGDCVVYRVGAGELWQDPSFDFRPRRLKVGEEGLSGWVAACGEPALVPDVSRDPRYVNMEGSATRSELIAPILVRGEVAGVLDVQSDRANEFDETDLVILQSLAHQAGTAIENARLYEQARQAAVTEERSRLARELHDAVTQTLFSASLLAEALPQTWERSEMQGRQVLADLRQLSRGALAEMRTLLLELRPAALVEADFGDLLRQLAEAASGREGLPVAVTMDCQCDLPEEVHIALYRIAQEALNNVVKHAWASKAEVNFDCSTCNPSASSLLAPERRAQRRVTLTVRDDGRGFEAAAVLPDRMGLGIMRERANAIGATLAVSSAVGEGTTIEVVWEEGNSHGK